MAIGNLLSSWPSRRDRWGETRAQLVYALDFGYLKSETFCELDKLGKTATKCLGGLIRYLNDSTFRGRKFQATRGFNQPAETAQRRQAIESQNARRTLNAERRTPNAERRTVNAERRTPNAERRTPNAERRTPNAER
jgi:hypothetical protein